MAFVAVLVLSIGLSWFYATSVLEAEEWSIADSDVLYYAKTKSGVFSSSNGPIKYDLAVAVPVENVYRHRAPFAGWVVGMLAALLIVICVVVMILLRKAVLRYVDGTNAALGDIMAGDLDRKVAQSSVSEFNELSDGINATVRTSLRSCCTGNADRSMCRPKRPRPGGASVAACSRNGKMHGIMGGRNLLI